MRPYSREESIQFIKTNDETYSTQGNFDFYEIEELEMIKGRIEKEKQQQQSELNQWTDKT